MAARAGPPSRRRRCLACERKPRAKRTTQVGGWLFLTNQRIIFVPHRVDEVTGGESWCCPVAQVALVTVERAQLIVPLLGLTARLRRRLRLELRDGAVELFVVNRVNAVVAALSGAVDSPKGPPPSYGVLGARAVLRSFRTSRNTDQS